VNSYPDDERPVLRLLRWILSLDEVIPWYSGYLFVGLTLRKRQDDWLLVVHAQRGKGERVVSYHTGHRPWYCFYGLAGAMKRMEMNWKADKYQK